MKVRKSEATGSIAMTPHGPSTRADHKGRRRSSRAMRTRHVLTLLVIPTVLAARPNTAVRASGATAMLVNRGGAIRLYAAQHGG